MNLTRSAFGTWNGGRYMHFGQQLSEVEFKELIRFSYDQGIRTFVSSDVYGAGRADSMLGEALAGVPRETYSLVGLLGHDFYEGQRAGAKGYPRFTDPALRGAEAYADYLKMACEKSLERCQSSHFDLVMLHNPDSIGYTHEKVWQAMQSLQDQQLTTQLGIAPGPANGFTLDLLECFERYGSIIDWAMLILNPFEPWPSKLLLNAAAQEQIEVIARVVDYGGLFHDDVKAGHVFRDGDHRNYRAAGWVEAGCEKLEKIRPIAERHGLTMMQLACLWNLAQKQVHSVVPTFIQEAHEEAKSIEDKILEMVKLPEVNPLNAEELQFIEAVGDNTGCMSLKGASQRHDGQEPRADEWAMRPELLTVAKRWGLGDTWAY